jgi:hypothetical protein
MQIEITETKKPEPPPKPEPKPAAVDQPVPTAEELAKLKQDAYQAMGWGEPPKEEAPVAPAAPAAASPEPAPAAPPVPEPPKPKKRKPIDAEALIAHTASEVGRAVAEAVKPQPPTPAPAPALDIELGPEDKDAYELALYLASTNPKHRETPAKLLTYIKELYAYQDKWVADHPDGQWNPDDGEHAAWYAAHPQPITNEELDDARIDRKVEQRYEQKIKPHLDMIEDERALKAAMPVLVGNIDRAKLAMVEAVDDKLAALLKNKDGEPELTAENVAKVEAADAIAKGILEQIVNRSLQPMLEELERTAIPQLKYRLDPRNNPVHAAIDEHRRRAESDIARLPAHEQVHDGRAWLSISEMANRQAAILNSNATQAEKQKQLSALDQRYWTLTVDDLEALIVDECAREAKARIAEIDGFAKKKYAKGAQPPTPPPPQPPTPVPTQQRPPSFSSSSDAMVVPESGAPSNKTWGEEAAAVHFK